MTHVFSKAVLLLASAASAFAQISAQTGAIRGVVLDPTDALIPDAKVTATSARGEVHSKSSSGEGAFIFPLLTPGLYSITAEKDGFARSTLIEVPVRVTETTQVTVRMVLGEEAIQLDVVASASPVNSANATLGNVIPGSVVSELPLAVRNFTNLLATSAATAAQIPDASATNRGAGVIFVNGQRATHNNLVINGADANNLASNNFNTVPVPSPDTIEEFRVQTSLYDASQGRTSGGNVNVITKGGGPAYHGQIYEFFRNEALNANNFFANKAGQARPVLRQNQFGGNFGGPVPGLENRTFFFGSYQGTRQTNGVFGLISAAVPVLPQQRTAQELGAAFGLAPSEVDPVAVALLNQPGQYNGFLLPSGTGAAPGQLGSVAFSAPSRFDEDQFNANGDHVFNDRHRLMMRYFQARATATDPIGGLGAGQFGSGTSGPLNNYLASVSESWTISPSAVNELRVSFNRVQSGTIPSDAATVGDIGMRRFNSAITPGIPAFAFSAEGFSFGGPAINQDNQTVANTFHLSDVLAFTRGRHTLRLGFEARSYQINVTNNFGVRGSLQYASFRDFLQGRGLQLANVASGAPSRDYRAQDVSWFVQDDWKLSRRLTLNLGLRYDYLGNAYDKRNRIGNFDDSRLDAQTLELGGAGLLRGFILPEGADFGSIQGTPGVSRSTLTEGNRMNFSPRVGLAWDVSGDGRTAIRAGYGIYYVRTSNQTLLQTLGTAPFYQIARVAGTPLANPFPNLPLPSEFPVYPAMPSLAGYGPQGQPLLTATPLSMNPIQRDFRTPYAQHWNITIQRQLPWQFVLETGYVGSQGVRLLQGLLTNQARLASEEAPIRGLTANSQINAAARVGVVGFAPTGFVTATGNGHSTYNAFVATVSRRMGGLFVLGNYTYAKSIDNNSGSAFNGQDLAFSGGNNLVPSLARGLSDFDLRHRFQLVYNYTPKGWGSAWVKNATRDWSFGGATTIQSGFPVAFACGSCASVNVYGIPVVLSPDVVGDFKNLAKGGNPRDFVDPGTSSFNPGVVAVPRVYPNGAAFGGNINAEGGPGNQTFRTGGTAGTGHVAQLFGTLPRNPGITSPAQQQWDFYAARRFPITEKVGIVLRAEFFNLFNHAIFGRPTAIVDNPAFGRYTFQQNAPRIIQFALKVEF
jgi:hypothetical protein